MDVALWKEMESRPPLLRTWSIFFKELFKFDKQLLKGHLILLLLLLFFLLPYCPTR